MPLQIIKAKPNPAGRDRIGNLSPQQQLAGEWVDVANVGSYAEDLSDIRLYHWAYKLPKPAWEIVMTFSGSLPAGEIMRIHSSGKISIDHLYPIDRIGADHHLFSGSGYVWNNDKDDKPILWNSKKEEYVDKTAYDAYPPEGRVLSRVGNKLV